MRVKASALGLEAEEYRAEWVGSDVEWSGTAALEVPDDVQDELLKAIHATGTPVVLVAFDYTAGTSQALTDAQKAALSAA